jgi:hypothetical protein
MITTLGNCRACEVFLNEAGFSKKVSQQEVHEYPQELFQESERLSHLLGELKQLYKHRVLIKLVDVKSFLGVYKSLRHRIREYPTFIVEGKEAYTGWDQDQLEGLIDKYIQTSIPPKHGSVQPNLP